MTARHSAYLKLLAVVLIWGIAPPIIKYTLSFFPTDIFLAYRFFISSLAMLPILSFVEKGWLGKLSRLPTSLWISLIVNAILGSVIQLGFLFYGLEYTTAIEGSIINALSPVLVAIAGYFYLHEKITFREKLGLFIAFAGSIVIVFNPVHNFKFINFGNLLIFLGTLAWAIFTVVSKKHLRLHFSPLFLTAFTFFIGLVVMTVLIFVSNFQFQISNYFARAPLSAHAGVFYMALFSGSLAYFFYQSAAKYIEISEANLFLYLTPIVTLPISIFVLKETLSLPFIFGCVIILIGVILAEFKPR